MKLTSKGRYAVMALMDLAKFNSRNPVSLRDISLRQGISLDFLEQIFSKLKRNEIVQSIRGTQGGYILNKQPNEIKLANIFHAVDETVKTVQCKKEAGESLYTVNALISTKKYGIGKGLNKKTAEQEAAKKTLEELGEI